MHPDKKWHICDKCGKTLSSYHSLWRHKKLCPHSHKDNSNIKNWREEAANYPSWIDEKANKPHIGFHRKNESTQNLERKNPKIQALLDEIVNDDTRYSSTDSSTYIPSIEIAKNDWNHSNNEPSSTDGTELKEINNDISSSKPHTLQKVNSFEGFIEAKSSDEEEGEQSIDDLPPPDKVEFLPTTKKGLCKRFHKLYAEFTRENKLENRNELVVLLDELLRRKVIDRGQYRQMNNLIAQSLGSGIDPGGEDIKDIVSNVETQAIDMQLITKI